MTRKRTTATSDSLEPFKPTPISLLERSLSQCAFPIEGEPGPDMARCGASVEFGLSWRSHHQDIVWPKGQGAGKGFKLSKIGVAA